MLVRNKIRYLIKFNFKFAIYLFIIDFDIFWLVVYLAGCRLASLASLARWLLQFCLGGWLFGYLTGSYLADRPAA